MRKEQVQEYSARITSNNRTQLVVTIYDLILLSIEEAEQFFAQSNLIQFKHSVSRAQALVRELTDALDLQYEISMELLQLYLFINRRLVQATVRKDTEPLRGLDKVIGNLRGAFEVISKADTSAPLMKNAQKIYAGLTYGRDNISEFCQTDMNRGFRA